MNFSASGESGGDEDAHAALMGHATTEFVAEEELEVIKKAMEGTENDEEEAAKKASLLFVTLHEIQRSHVRHLLLPDDTLYSASLAIPMIARSSGYPLTLTTIAVKMVSLNMFCMILQTVLLASTVVARDRLPHLDGVPALCTYGQDVGSDRWPVGPNGIRFGRWYDNVETDYTMLVVRNNLWRAMQQLNLTASPELGPVEYGAESATCRLACVAVFCIAVCQEIFMSFSMMNFLWHSPTQNWGQPQMPWVKFNEEVKKDTFDEALWQSIGKSKLDYVTFMANGAPRSWKLFTALLLLGHFLIVFDVFWNGVILLLNTGGIVELILNSLAMTFIIELDRVMFRAFTRALTKDMMHRLQPYVCRLEKNEITKGYDEHQGIEWEYSLLQFCWKTIQSNWPMFFMLGTTFLGHYLYFFIHCELVSYPLNFGDWFSTAYFKGQTRVMGGWEFLMGAWRSKPIIFNNETLCAPAIVSVDGKTMVQPVQGCGWPKGWNVSI